MWCVSYWIDLPCLETLSLGWAALSGLNSGSSLVMKSREVRMEQTNRSSESENIDFQRIQFSLYSISRVIEYRILNDDNRTDIPNLETVDLKIQEVISDPSYPFSEVKRAKMTSNEMMCLINRRCFYSFNTIYTNIWQADEQTKSQVQPDKD